MNPLGLARQYRKQIEAALAYASGTHTFDDIVAELEAGKVQIWPGHESVAITEIRTFPQLKVLNIVLAGGNLKALEVMMGPILDWGREQGCTRVMMLGRPGWARSFLSKAGWQPTAILMEADL